MHLTKYRNWQARDEKGAWLHLCLSGEMMSMLHVPDLFCDGQTLFLHSVTLVQMACSGPSLATAGFPTPHGKFEASGV